MPIIIAKRNNKEISEELMDLIIDRGNAIKQLEIEKARELDK